MNFSSTNAEARSAPVVHKRMKMERKMDECVSVNKPLELNSNSILA